MTAKKELLDTGKQTKAESVKINKERIVKIASSKYFAPVLFLILTVLYFSPALTFNSIIMGTDDGSRGWLEKKMDYKINDRSNVTSPVNGGSNMVDGNFTRDWINPVYFLFYKFLPQYMARTLDYCFWTFFAGFGMFFYLGMLGLPRSVSILGGLVFMFAPAFQSFIFAGHFARMQAIALMPWLLYFTERMCTKTSVIGSLVNLVFLAGVMALTVYSLHLQFVYFIFLGMGVYFAARILYPFIKKQLPFTDALFRTLFFLATLGCGFLLSSMNLIPSMQHTAESSKRAGGVTYEYAASFALHPEEFISLFEPDFIGWKEYYWGRNPLKLNSEYFGICILLLAMMGFVMRKPDFKRWLFAGFFIFGVLYSLGPHTPLHKLFYLYAPKFKNFRGPSQMFLWFFLPGIVLAMYALHDMLTRTWEEHPKLLKRLYLFAGIAGGLALVYLLGTTQIGQFWYSNFYPSALKSNEKVQILQYQLSQSGRFGAFTILVCIGTFFGLLYLRIKNKVGNTGLIIGLSIVCLVDLVRVSRPFLVQSLKPVHYVSRQDEFERSVAQFLKQKDPSIYRVYSMLGDQKQYIRGLEFTYNFEDFINKKYYDLIEPLLSISYYLQQQGGGSSQPLELGFRNMLNILNTKYILSGTTLASPHLTEVISSGNFRIYENSGCFPRYYLSSTVIPVQDSKEYMLKKIESASLHKDSVIVAAEAWKEKRLNPETDATVTDSILVKTYDPFNGISAFEVKSSREQMLVMLENFDKGWKATVNGSPSVIYPVNHYARGVIVPKGTSTVELAFHSAIAARWIRITAITFYVYLIFAIGVFVLYFLRRKPKNS